MIHYPVVCCDDGQGNYVLMSVVYYQLTSLAVQENKKKGLNDKVINFLIF